MTTQISLSLTLRKRGDRVVCKAAKDEWYTGTVTSMTTVRLNVKFDDGATAKIDEEDFKDVKPMIIDFVSNDPLTDAEARPLYIKGATIPSKLKLTVVKPEEKLVPADVKLLELAQPEIYSKLQGSNNTALILKWMATTWTTLNRLYFKNEMTRPVFVVLSFAQEQKNKIGGVWKADSRQLCLGVSLFENAELRMLKTMLHEMCHQAVSELNNLVGVGHGEAWGRRMYSVGQPVYLQTDITHDVPYMLKFEPAEPAGIPASGKVNVVVPDYQQFYKAPVHNVAAIKFTKSGAARRGLLLGNNDADATSAYFVTVPSSDRYEQVELSEMYVMPKEESSEFFSQMWRKSADRIAEKLGLNKVKAPALFVRGDRVIVRSGVNKWLLGTVTDVSDIVKVRMDNDIQVDVQAQDIEPNLRRVLTKRKSVMVLTDKQAKAIAL